MVIKRMPDSELYHHGIKGQRWGVRRYQNPDGTLTPEGKARYGTVENFERAQKEKKKKIYTAAAIGAGVTLAAAAAYVARNHYIREKVGETISDMDAQRVTFEDIDEKAANGRMYVSNNIFDNIKYRGLYGAGSVGVSNGSYTVNKVNFKNIKVAPDKVSREEFMKLYKNDSDFKNHADDLIKLYDKDPLKTLGQTIVFKKASKNNASDKSLYDAYNIAQNGAVLDSDHKKQVEKFYDAVKNRGFNSIYDRNDNSYSGYGAKSAKIILPGSNATVKASKTIDTYSGTSLKDFVTGQAVFLGEKAIVPAVAAIGGGSIKELYKMKKEENKNGSKKNSKR